MTDALQQRAAAPERSVFVSANAGTGKTKMLIERVLRLLLSGEVPETILCVTFTNAAASEIEERLHRKLAQWAVMGQEALMDDIKKMTGQLPSQQMVDVARRLFAKVIDNDQGPRIETTHSFSQSLLSRFPVEAGLPPHFTLITDGEKEGLLRAGFASCFAEPAQEMKDALSCLTAMSAHQTLFDHVKSFVGFRKLSDAAIAQPLGFVRAFDQAMRALNPYDTDDLQALTNITCAQLQQLPHQPLGKAMPDHYAKFQTWLALPVEAQQQRFDEMIALFMTKTGSVRKNLIAKKIAEEEPMLEDLVHKIAAILIQAAKAQTGIKTALISRALYVVGRHVALYYERAKLRQAVLDYDDLIIKADRLLSASDAMAWVRWKLDFGIHHMLVDEAQDTNPAQWELLSSLADEFFVHEADADQRRTLFSVGDFKQSIYSFQGANPHIFLQKAQAIEAQAVAGGHAFEEVKLTMSFRSSKAVLDMVNAVMSLDAVEGLGGSYHAHRPFFDKKFGMVEVWPVLNAAEKPDELPYFDVAAFVSDAQDQAFGADALMAEKVAAHIETLLNGTATGLAGRRYEPGDILILVNKRDAFFALVRGALRRKHIPVAGADRMRLDQQIEIQDLVALGDACLLPEDDLQLAALLKSPLIGLDEEALMTLAAERPQGQRLIAALKSYAGQANALGKAIAQLEAYFDLAIQLSPMAFYATILAQGGREAFYARLGAGVDDSLNAFIARAYEFETTGGVSLADFLAYHRANDADIKRDFGTGEENQVRVMTIHGAKGLEAPVVYVPDMVRGVEPPSTLIKSSAALYWPSEGLFLPDEIAAHKEADKQARAAEHQRLLYVAMTRASECLFMAGFEKNRKSQTGISWHELLQQGCDAMGLNADGDGIMRLVHEGDTQRHQQKQGVASQPLGEAELRQRYGWAFSPPTPEQQPLRPLKPSQAETAEVAETISSAPQSLARQEGLFLHALLHDLSRIEAHLRSEVALRLARNAVGQHAMIAAERRQELALSMIEFMSLERFAPLFGPKALSEFSVSGMVGHRAVVGQIDKMVITTDKIWLVDFKSGQPKTDQVPQAYLLQMALYASLIEEIYPDYVVETQIIWLRDYSVSQLLPTQRKDALRQAGLLE